MSSVQRKLNEAFERTGWTVAELLGRSGLSIDRSSMSRKIRGKAPMITAEAEAIARALGRKVTVTRAA